VLSENYKERLPNDQSLSSMPAPFKSLVNMSFLSIAIACLLAFSLSTSASPVLSQVDGVDMTHNDAMLFLKYLESQAAIDQATYDDLVLYTKYSSAVYQSICPHPLGDILVKQVCFFFV